MSASGTITNITNVVSELVGAVAPIVSVAAPELGPAFAILSKIVAGVQTAEPTAINLWTRLTSNQPVTAAQLAQFASDYETQYQKLNADINAKLARL